MTVEHLSVVLHHSKAVGTRKLVLIGVANHDGDGGSFPSVGTLANYAGITESGVRKHLRALEEMGELQTEENGGGQRNTPKHMRTNLYRTTVLCPINCDHTPHHRLLCLTCSDPLPRARYKAGVHTPGDCCPLSGQVGRRACVARNHAPGLCLWPGGDE